MPYGLPIDTSNLKPYGRLGVAWLAMSSAAIVIVIAAPVPPLVIAAARLGITTLACAILAARVLGRTWRALCSDRGAARMWFLSGVLLAAHFAMWITSLSLTSVVHATVLVALQPLFAGVFGRMLGDRAGWRLYLGIPVALTGTWILTTTADGGDGDVTLLGDALAVLAAAASAAYLIAGRHVGERVPLAGWLTSVNGLAFLLLAMAALVFEADWDPASLSAGDGLALVWLGLVPGLIGHGLMNWTARDLPVHTVSLAVLLEPVGATLLALGFLDQSVSSMEVVGGVVLVCGAWLANGSHSLNPTG